MKNSKKCPKTIIIQTKCRRNELDKIKIQGLIWKMRIIYEFEKPFWETRFLRP